MRIVLSRRSRRRLRGAALFEFLLGALAAAVLGLSLTLWWQDREDQSRARESGRIVAMLAAAADAWLVSSWPALTTSIGGGSEVALATLRSEGMLPEGFQAIDGVAKRDLAVLVMPIAGGGGFQALSGHVDFPADDVARPSAGLIMGHGRQLMGMVETTCPPGIGAPCLIGPMIRTSLAGFAGAFPGRDLRAGALMSLTAIRHEDWCRDMIKRRPAAAAPCPESHRMASALHMGGWNLEANNLGAVDLRADGDLTLTSALTVTRNVDVAAALDISGSAVVAGDVAVTTAIGADDVRVLGSMRVGSAGTGAGTLGIDDEANVTGCAQGGTLSTRGGGDVDRATVGASTC